MFCIASFIVLLVMGAFSARYRVYLKKSWNCTFRRLTFRACDTTFREDTKSRMLAPLALRAPQLVKPASAGLEIAAVLLILTTVWSAYTAVKTGANLFVYGTCDKQNSESCSLGAQACSIQSSQPTFDESIASGDVLGAFLNEFGGLGETFAAIPARVRTWNAEEYAPANASYLQPFDASKPTAVEIIDPGCEFCGKLFRNIEAAGFADKYNVTYIPFPIPTGAATYKFANSLLVTQYLEALRLSPIAGQETPVDWQLLSKLYTEKDSTGTYYLTAVESMGATQVRELLATWMTEAGMTETEIASIVDVAASSSVADIIAANRQTVQENIHTVKIPTIIFGGRRHDGVVEIADLH
jgi:hypothetical protein